MTHKINHGWVPPADPISDRYQREVDRSTDRGDRAYARAVKRLEAAERRLARVAAIPQATRSVVKEQAARLIVEARREELVILARQMQATPASSVHFGVGSYRGVAIGRSVP